MMWAGLKYISRERLKSVISTTSVNRVHKIQKDDRGDTESSISLDIVFEPLGLKISPNFI